MISRKGVKSEEIRAGRVMRTHTACQKPEKKSQCVREQSVTNFNGDGGEHSHAEKRRIEGHRVVKAPTELHQKS